MNHLVGQNAPSPKLVIPHFLTGAVFFWVLCLLLVWNGPAFTQHYFSPGLLSLTHLTVLGWISMVILGALYQLIPVVMEVKLFSEKLGWASYLSLLVGTLLITTSFWFSLMGFWMVAAAFFLVVSIGIFSVNVWLTSRRSRVKHIARLFINTSVFWLFITALIGALLAINLVVPYLPVNHLLILRMHAHAGMAGWFLMLIIGVSSVLMPMFLVSEKVPKKPLTFSYILLQIGLLSGLVSLYFDWHPGVMIGVASGMLGVMAFFWFLFRVFSSRARKKLDTGMRQTVLAFLLLGIPILLMGMLTIMDGLQYSPGIVVWNAYGAVWLLGFVTALILGQSFKTLPFIVWLHVYKDQVGKTQIPYPVDLYSEKGFRWQNRVYVAGMTVFLTGILMVREWILLVGGILLLITASIYVYQIIRIASHKPGWMENKKASGNSNEVLSLLKQVIDPELMINIVDLGLVYRVDLDRKMETIEIDMTLSSKACPLGDAILENVHQVVSDGYPGWQIDLQLVWEPIWSAERISKEGRLLMQKKAN